MDTWNTNIVGWKPFTHITFEVLENNCYLAIFICHFHFTCSINNYMGQKNKKCTCLFFFSPNFVHCNWNDNHPQQYFTKFDCKGVWVKQIFLSYFWLLIGWYYKNLMILFYIFKIWQMWVIVFIKVLSIGWSQNFQVKQLSNFTKKKNHW